MPQPPSSTVRVWDLPTRLFHWLLVINIVGSVVTINLGGNWVETHFWLGYCALTLLLFRLVWGLVGPRYARFSNFIYGPKPVWGYLRGQGRYLGHNPLGAFSVFALLASLTFQAVTGLFANDDIASEGPLVRLIDKDLSDRLTGLHHWNANLLYVLIGLHVAAILFYVLFRREQLIKPMITGDKVAEPGDEPAQDTGRVRWMALVALGLAAAVVTAVVQS